ncbi:TPA: hypothetical protein EYP75_05945, partial [Candidatus Bathyarchaeota archaeon]|nr:hypothetical protein [Candidatus Bathyarchaeota archaeon]
TFEQIFLEVIVEGCKERGIFGPVSHRTAMIVKNLLKLLILGEDPFSVEKIWDIMYRSQIHGLKGETIIALSAVDCALWDFIGKVKRAGCQTFRRPSSREGACLREYAWFLCESR